MLLQNSEENGHLANVISLFLSTCWHKHWHCYAGCFVKHEVPAECQCRIMSVLCNVWRSPELADGRITWCFSTLATDDLTLRSPPISRFWTASNDERLMRLSNKKQKVKKSAVSS